MIAKDCDGNTTLHLACIHNHETIALILISKFPDLARVRNADRQTPLFYATDSVRKAYKGGTNSSAFIWNNVKIFFFFSRVPIKGKKGISVRNQQ